MAESMPTKAVMPMLMISMVMMALKRLALMEFKAMDIFSRRNFKSYKSRLLVISKTNLVLNLQYHIPHFLSGFNVFVSGYDVFKRITTINKGFVFAGLRQFF